eukprot:gene41771-51740_t
MPHKFESLRMFLASQGGGRKGDLSRFIEEAVRAHILELTAEQAKKNNAGVSESELNAMVNEAVQWATPDIIYRAWRAAKFEVGTSQEQLDELRRASRYPKFQAILQPHRVGAMVNNLQRAIVLDHLTADVEADDPNDAFLLAMSLAGD